MGHKFAMLQLASLAILLAAGTGSGKELQWESTIYAGSKSPTHELPRPLTPPMELTDSGYTERNPRSRRPTLMDVALQQSVQQGLNAMAELYGKIQPQMLLNGGHNLMLYCSTCNVFFVSLSLFRSFFVSLLQDKRLKRIIRLLCCPASMRQLRKLRDARWPPMRL